MTKIEVIVKPNSPKNEIIKLSETKYKVSIKAKPKNNKANIALEKFLTKYFKKPVKIISGFSSKKKLIKL
jgi:hypothetical protein